MGWWNAPDNQQVSAGDAVLDLARHFLRHVSYAYHSVSAEVAGSHSIIARAATAP